MWAFPCSVPGSHSKVSGDVIRRATRNTHLQRRTVLTEKNSQIKDHTGQNRDVRRSTVYSFQGSLLARGHLPKLGTTEPQEETPQQVVARLGSPSVRSPWAGCLGGDSFTGDIQTRCLGRGGCSGGRKTSMERPAGLVSVGVPFPWRPSLLVFVRSSIWTCLCPNSLSLGGRQSLGMRGHCSDL